MNPPIDSSATDAVRPAVRKVQHPLKARLLQVRRKVMLTPHMVRITLAGEDLAGFVSEGFDDHVKLFFPAQPDAVVQLPTFGPKGPQWPEHAPRPVARDYTPRRYDAQAGELDIDFVLHGEGPATTWAAQARPGQFLGVGGPRGSFVVPLEYDWHLLIGDETALPAIARRLQELPAEARAIVVVETRDPSVRLALESAASVKLQWVHGAADANNGRSALETAVRGLLLPEGMGYAWAAGEYSVIRGIREHLVRERGIDKACVRAASYWRRGPGASHEVFGD